MSIFRSEKFEKTLGVILDVLFAFVLLFSVFMAVSTLAQRENGALGLRFGVIRSKSMEKSELYVGDVVFVNRDEEYDVADIIVFYRAPSAYQNAFTPEAVKNCSVWVHEVIEVSFDESGRRTYLTKGTSNAYNDGFFVPQDFVIGRAAALPSFLNKMIGFVGSRAGIISLIICPCAVMAIYLIWELIILFTSREQAQFASEPRGYYIKTFTARLVLSDEIVKARYSAIKNALLSLSRVKARVGKRCETFRAGGKPLAKLNIRGKKILLYLALNPAALEAKFFITDVSEGGDFYGAVPALFKVTSERGVKFACELISQLGEVHGLKTVEKPAENFAPPQMSVEQLLAAGYIKRTSSVEFFERRNSAAQDFGEEPEDGEDVAEEIISAKECAAGEVSPENQGAGSVNAESANVAFAHAFTETTPAKYASYAAAGEDFPESPQTDSAGGKGAK